MRYLNLWWAIKFKRLPAYMLAQAIGVSDSTFSMAMAGQREFSPEERETIAAILRFKVEWLFAELTPPADARLREAAIAKGGTCAQA